MAKPVVGNVYECLKSRVLLDQVADKWTILVLGLLSKGPLRFNEIKRGLEGVSQKTLTQCLRKLERNGAVAREVLDGTTLAVVYSLTKLGDSMSEPFEAVFAWVGRHASEVEAAQKRFDGRQKAKVG